MTRYILRAVSRCSNGIVANIVESWCLGSCTLADAMAQADRQHWGEFWDEANAFEITDETGRWWRGARFARRARRPCGDRNPHRNPRGASRRPIFAMEAPNQRVRLWRSRHMREGSSAVRCDSSSRGKSSPNSGRLQAAPFCRAAPS
jgi:hypothetical protein